MWDDLRTRLEGRIVELEPLEPRHGAALERVGSDPAIWRWMSVSTIAAWLQQAFAEAGRAPYVVLLEGAPVGSSSYLSLAPEHRRLEIGHTWLTPSTWSSGANVDAKLLLLRHAFERLGCIRVEFKTDADNQRSRRALEAIPAQFEGVHRKHMLVRGGERRDSAWYSVLDDEWPAVKANLERRVSGKASAQS